MSKLTRFRVRALLVAAAALAFHGNLTAQYLFEQLDDADGLAVMEAEHYSNLVVEGKTSTWEKVSTPEFYSGEGGMQALPGEVVYNDAAGSGQPNALANSAILEYTINFVRADTVFIWIRGSRPDDASDSYHAGLDGVIYDISERIAFRGEIFNAWDWQSTTIAGETVRPRLYIDGPGVHTFQVYIREGGMSADKFVLTTNRDYIPEIFSGLPEGPPETLLTSVDSPNLTVNDFQLYQNYPNPFTPLDNLSHGRSYRGRTLSNGVNPGTTISYNLAKAGRVTLDIYNVSGRVVTRLVDGLQPAGRREIAWDARDANGAELASGVYLARLRTDSFCKTIRMLLMR